MIKSIEWETLIRRWNTGGDTKTRKRDTSPVTSNQAKKTLKVQDVTWGHERLSIVEAGFEQNGRRHDEECKVKPVMSGV